jgi:hypothetical protein
MQAFILAVGMELGVKPPKNLAAKRRAGKRERPEEGSPRLKRQRARLAAPPPLPPEPPLADSNRGASQLLPQSCPFELRLGVDVLATVFSFLDLASDLGAASRVSRFWRSTLRRHPRFETLAFRGASFRGDRILGALRSLPLTSVRVLELDSCRVSVEAAAELVARLSKLRGLRVASCAISDRQLRQLVARNASTLEDVALERSPIHVAVGAFAPRLARLSLRESTHCDPNSFLRPPASAPLDASPEQQRLRVVDLSGCARVNLETLSLICSRASESLVELRLTLTRFQPSHLNQLLSCCPRLEVLHAAGCEFFTHLDVGHGALRVLNVNRSRLASLRGEFPLLEELHAAWTPLPAEDFTAVATKSTRLRFVDCSGSRIDSAAVRAIEQRHPQCRFDVSSCRSLDRAHRLSLARKDHAVQ